MTKRQRARECRTIAVELALIAFVGCPMAIVLGIFLAAFGGADMSVLDNLVR